VSVCLRFKDKPFELSAPHFVHEYSMEETRHALTLRSKGQDQGHAVIRCAAGVCTQVDMSAYRFLISFVIAASETLFRTLVCFFVCLSAYVSV